MRRQIFGAAVAVGVMLAGCEAEQPNGQKPLGGEASIGQDVEKRLASMPDGQRDAVFIRAIRDAGFECQHVESSDLGGDHKGMPMWTVRCREAEWAVLVSPSGMAQVIDCRQAAEAGLPECLPAENIP
jgi:hypothetical protein